MSTSRRPAARRQGQRQGRRRAASPDWKQYYANPPGQPPASAIEMDKRYQQALKHRFTGRRSCSDQAPARPREGLPEGDLRRKVLTATSRTTTISTRRPTRRPLSPRAAPSATSPSSRRRCRQLTSSSANPRSSRIWRRRLIDTSSKVNGGSPRRRDQGRTVPRSTRLPSRSRRTRSTAGALPVGWHIIQATGPIKPGKPATPTPLPQVKERSASSQLALTEHGDAELAQRDEEDVLQEDRLRAGLRAPARAGSPQDD